MDATGVYKLGAYKGAVRNVNIGWNKSFDSFSVVLNPFVFSNRFCIVNGDNDTTYVWFGGKCYCISDCVGRIESICFLKDLSGVMIFMQSDINDYAVFQVGPKGKVRFVCFGEGQEVYDISDTDIFDIQRYPISWIIRQFV